MTAQYQRTIMALPNDTLDAIAYRVYAHRAQAMLPTLINNNANYSPHAKLPPNAIIILPADTATAAAPAIKLWD